VQPPSFTRTQQIMFQKPTVQFRSINLCCKWHQYEQPSSHSSLTCLPPCNSRGQYENFIY